jgi:hypothetical protein
VGELSARSHDRHTDAGYCCHRQGSNDITARCHGIYSSVCASRCGKANISITDDSNDHHNVYRNRTVHNRAHGDCYEHAIADEGRYTHTHRDSNHDARPDDQPR